MIVAVAPRDAAENIPLNPTAWTVTAAPADGTASVTGKLDQQGRVYLNLSAAHSPYGLSMSNGTDTVQLGGVQVTAGSQEFGGGQIGGAGVAAAGSLTGNTLASNVTASSLTSVGTLASPIMTSPSVSDGNVTLSLGGGDAFITRQTGTNGDVILRNAGTGNIIFRPQDNPSNDVHIGSDGSLQIGVPTGGDKGAGTINVATGVYLNGTAYTNPDFVFEHHYTGKIDRYADKKGAAEYQGLRSLEELEAHVSTHYAFPGLGQDSGVDVFAGGEALLLITEELALHIIGMNKRLRRLEDAVARLTVDA